MTRSSARRPARAGPRGARERPGRPRAGAQPARSRSARARTFFHARAASEAFEPQHHQASQSHVRALHIEAGMQRLKSIKKHLTDTTRATRASHKKPHEPRRSHGKCSRYGCVHPPNRRQASTPRMYRAVPCRTRRLRWRSGRRSLVPARTPAHGCTARRDPPRRERTSTQESEQLKMRKRHPCAHPSGTPHRGRPITHTYHVDPTREAPDACASTHDAHSRCQRGGGASLAEGRCPQHPPPHTTARSGGRPTHHPSRGRRVRRCGSRRPEADSEKSREGEDSPAPYAARPRARA